ncbi:MAG: hypothetical protein ABI434_19080 [Burkholderiaceae bacterium]
MSLYGLGAVTIWHDLLPEARDDFYAWHGREHMPERVGIAGFTRGRRYIAVRGAPEFFNLYEAVSPEVLSGQDYLNRLNAPTPWTRSVVGSFRNVSRAICRVLYSGGVGQGGTMLTLRFAIDDAQAPALCDTLRQQVLPALIDRHGIVGAHLCRADDQGSRVMTAEKQVRNQDTDIPGWIVLIEGISVAAVEAAAFALQQTLASQSPPAHDLDLAIYQLESQRCKLPWGDV